MNSYNTTLSTVVILRLYLFYESSKDDNEFSNYYLFYGKLRYETCMDIKTHETIETLVKFPIHID